MLKFCPARSQTSNLGAPIRRTSSKLIPLLLTACLVAFTVSGCHGSGGDPELTRNVYLELVDWHVSGLWVINAPVAWVRVANNNRMPITDIQFEYNTFDENGVMLNHGTYAIHTSDGDSAVVGPRQTKNFCELYLGTVDLRSQKLSVKLISVNHK